MQQQFPQLELQIIIGNTKEIIQYTKLLQVDIGLIEGQAQDNELVIKPFMQDELFIVSASNHPLTKQQPITPINFNSKTGLPVKKALGHVII